MYQTIGEKIKVAGVYHQAKFQPVWFEWQRQRYSITRVTLQSRALAAGRDQEFYSVLAAGNLYRLEFNRHSSQWQLLAVWVEGGD